MLGFGNGFEICQKLDKIIFEMSSQEKDFHVSMSLDPAVDYHAELVSFMDILVI